MQQQRLVQLKCPSPYAIDATSGSIRLLWVPLGLDADSHATYAVELQQASPAGGGRQRALVLLLLLQLPLLSLHMVLPLPLLL